MYYMLSFFMWKNILELIIDNFYYFFYPTNRRFDVCLPKLKFKHPFLYYF